MAGRLGLYAELVRLDRPIGIFLLLWPGLWALWIAGEGEPLWWV
ncbi:MAG: 4-hydroxybenzoate octaprenyltransferase, partial [Sedimenticolaceae bacterium]|nr:4-hydroxybenzoate octaprenyltransferase [Sedimenticolaceae bacterium]